MSRKELGWDSHFEDLWQEGPVVGCVPGRVVSQHRGLWRIAGDFEERWAAPSGKMRAVPAGSDWPAVGDWVVAEIPDGDKQAIIQGVLPRRSQFVRKTAGKRVVQQVIVANVDTAFIVVALDGDFNLRRLERYLAQGKESGATPMVLLMARNFMPTSNVLLRSYNSSTSLGDRSSRGGNTPAATSLCSMTESCERCSAGRRFSDGVYGGAAGDGGVRHSE